MIGLRGCVGVLPGRLLFISLGKGRLAHLRSEGNGCPFLGPQEVTRKAVISLELEWVSWVFAAWTPWNRSPEAQA